MMFAAAMSTSRNDVPRSLADVLIALPYSVSVTVTCESLIATGVTSVSSVSGDVAADRSAYFVNTTDEPGIDWLVGMTSAA